MDIMMPKDRLLGKSPAPRGWLQHESLAFRAALLPPEGVSGPIGAIVGDRDQLAYIAHSTSAGGS